MRNKTTQVVIDNEMHAKLKLLAKGDDRTLSNFMKRILLDYLEQPFVNEVVEQLEWERANGLAEDNVSSTS
jgi:hypothetical protein